MMDDPLAGLDERRRREAEERQRRNREEAQMWWRLNGARLGSQND